MKERSSAGTIRVGIYGSLGRAERAVEALRGVGFSKAEISVLCPEALKLHFAARDLHAKPGAHTTEAVTTGSSIGAILGGVGAAVAVAASGGTGVVVLGPLLGGTATGAILGGLVAALTARGIEPEVAGVHDRALQQGKILIAVQSADDARLADAQRAFAVTGAEKIAAP